MKAKIYDITGKEKGSIDLPKSFSARIREDIISRYIETNKTQQPYAPSPQAGKQHSAKGVLVHKRKVWKSQYGRGMSRVPRKIFMRRGSQFRWEGAFSPNTRGGMRAHPPKILQFLKKLKFNKKEAKIAFDSALSATANAKKVAQRYSRISEKEVKPLPFIVESKILGLKTKQILESLEKILGKDLFEIAIKKKSIRSGKGKSRGRKYKSTAGLLFVVGKGEKLKTTAFDVRKADELRVEDLTKVGNSGRLTIYTEEAIKNLGERK